jgi:hypothetical protein
MDRVAFQYNLKRRHHMLLIAFVELSNHPSVRNGYRFLII